jgi:FlaA1/EpsC-like NDP-sugar epimerase
MGFTIQDEKNPKGEIKLQFSGLRPGEKLYEELLIDDHAKPTRHSRILTANERSLSWSDVSVILNDINDAMRAEDTELLRQILLAAPLEYQPENTTNINVVEKDKKNISNNNLSESIPDNNFETITSLPS